MVADVLEKQKRFGSSVRKTAYLFSCRECTDKMQLKNFSEKLLRENIPARSYITEFSDWEKAFRAITELPYGDAKSWW